MHSVNNNQITSQDLSMYLNSSVLDKDVPLFTNYDKPNSAKVSDFNTAALPFYPPLSSTNLLNLSSNKSSFSIMQEESHPKSPTLNKLALTILDDKDAKEKDQDQEHESIISDYSPTPPLPTQRSFCKYDISCNRPVCQYVHGLEWYKLSNHFTRIETIHMNEYNDIIKYKLQYPSLNKIYTSLSETHLKIAENAKADAEKFMTDESHLTLNLKENLNFVESKGRNFSNTKKQYLDEAPKKIIPRPYDSGSPGLGTSSRLRQERVPRSQHRNTNVDAAGGGASAESKGRGVNSVGNVYSLDEIEASYVYKPRDDLFSGGKKKYGNAPTHNEPVEKVHYPKVYNHVKNSQVNSSNNWRDSERTN